MKADRHLVAISLMAVVGLGGCATNRSVEERVSAAQAATDKKIESVEGQIEDLQQRQKMTSEQLAKLSQEAREALLRAEEAGILAKGQVVFEESFTEDRVRFNLNSARLSSDSQSSLDEFATKVKALQRPVYIEIQGHTDATGSEELNEELGEDRAESVRRYLARKHHLPLLRMSTMTYGELMPSEPNKSREGRMKNRRVVLVVLE